MLQLDLAACHDVHGSVFFPEPGDRAAEDAAKQICAGCPVRLECLALALQSNDLEGVWGGLTGRERARHARAHGSPRARRG